MLSEGLLVPLEIAGGRIAAASSLTRVYYFLLARLCRLALPKNFTLRLLVQPVDDMEQCIAGHDVGVGLGAPLGVEGAGDVAELTEEVEAVDDKEESTLEEGSREASIPDEVAGVQVFVGIAGAAVEADVGAEVELPR